MKRNLVPLMLILPLLLAACQSDGTTQAPDDEVGEKVSVAGGSYTDITVTELQTMLADKDFVFVNVHIPFEGNIEKTDLSIPYDEIAENLEQLPSDKDAKVVLYCRSDRMSRIAAEELVSLGYTNIWNLEGGMVAWEQAGLEIEE